MRKPATAKERKISGAYGRYGGYGGGRARAAIGPAADGNDIVGPMSRIREFRDYLGYYRGCFFAAVALKKQDLSKCRYRPGTIQAVL